MERGLFFTHDDYRTYLFKYALKWKTTNDGKSQIVEAILPALTIIKKETRVHKFILVKEFMFILKIIKYFKYSLMRP